MMQVSQTGDEQRPHVDLQFGGAFTNTKHFTYQADHDLKYLFSSSRIIQTWPSFSKSKPLKVKKKAKVLA
jgi:hypothetical protein